MKKEFCLANLTIRFYESDGWTIEEVREYLVDPNTEITRRECGNTSYFAVYERSGHKVFNKYLAVDHNCVCQGCTTPSELNWYIAD